MTISAFAQRGRIPAPAAGGPHTLPWIPPSSRQGLLATFNGGFKLDSAQGGFYLNGRT